MTHRQSFGIKAPRLQMDALCGNKKKKRRTKLSEIFEHL